MNIFWFRRDLRINDNTALHKSLSECDKSSVDVIKNELLLVGFGDIRMCSHGESIYQPLRNVEILEDQKYCLEAL